MKQLLPPVLHKTVHSQSNVFTVNFKYITKNIPGTSEFEYLKHTSTVEESMIGEQAPSFLTDPSVASLC